MKKKIIVVSAFMTIAIIILVFLNIKLNNDDLSQNSYAEAHLGIKSGFPNDSSGMRTPDNSSNIVSDSLIQSSQNSVEVYGSGGLNNSLADMEMISELNQDITKYISYSLIPESLPMRNRIAKDINILKAESLEQSLDNLSQVGMFYWPGDGRDGAGGINFPLPESIGQSDINRVLSNRRCLKIFDELSNVSGSEAVSLINEKIGEMLPLYKNMFSESWKEVVFLHQDEPLEERKSIGPSLQIGNNPDGSPTLAGIRLQLLSLVIVAGNLQLEQTQASVINVVNEALSQRKLLYDSNSGFYGDRFSMLRKASLYNRQALATGVILTSSTQKSLINDESRWQTNNLTMYDAESTSYDLLTRNNGPIEADYSKGTIVVKVHKPIDDVEFDEILQSVNRK